MTLKEDIDYLEDNFHDDYKNLRFDEKYGPSEEGTWSQKTVDAWKRVKAAATAGENFGASDHLLVENQDLRGENYKLRGVAQGLQDFNKRLTDELMNVGAHVAKLLDQEVTWTLELVRLNEAVARRNEALQAAGVQIAELLADRAELQVKLYRG